MEKRSEAGQRPILAALDNSPRATDVLAGALEMARASSTPLVLLRCVRWPLELPAGIVGGQDEVVLTALTEDAKKDLLKLASDIPPPLLDSVQVAVGAPWRAICDEAARRNARLIVIGAHGYGGIERLLGTTAAKVVNHADRSVLVVRR